jgi:hypothetical protein
MVHSFFKRFAATGIVVGNLAEGFEAKHWRHMIEQSARKHRHREIALLAVGCIDLLAEPGKLFEIELWRTAATR